MHCFLICISKYISETRPPKIEIGGEKAAEEGSVSLSEQSDDIEYRHDRHKHQKQNQTDSVYDILDLTVEGFTLNSFYNEEKQPSAVKRREGDEIENTETQREDYRNIDKVHETLSCNIGHDSDGADDAGYIALMDTVREHITDCFRGELYDVPNIAE